MNYYNEFDPHAAAWLRELIAAGELPAGDVDDRSIEDVRPADLAGYTQSHFFAGLGGWPLALRLAGWPDDLPVWTGSCPCQPFSAAGSRRGTDDERHLWPAFRWLIDQCRPPAVYGEQVASVGAPHIRQRLWWVGHALGAGSQGHAGDGDHGDQPGRLDAAATGSAAEAGGTGFWANAIWIPCADGKQRRIEPGTQPLVDGIPRGVVPGCDPGAPGYAENTGEARKMRLYGYGNAIVPQVAAEFIRASMQ